MRCKINTRISERNETAPARTKTPSVLSRDLWTTGPPPRRSTIQGLRNVSFRFLNIIYVFVKQVNNLIL